MSIRYRLLGVGLLIAALALAGLFVIDRGLALPQLLEIEQARALADLQRARAALEREAIALDTLLVDWAFWDDTYQYIVDRNERYAAANLVPETFIVANVQLIVIYDLDGMPVWRGAFGPDGQPVVAFAAFPAHAPPQWPEVLVGSGTRPPLNSLQGLVRVDQGYALLAARPVLRTNLSGPPRGTLVMLRALGPKLLDDLRQAIGFHFDVEPLAVRASDAADVVQRERERILASGIIADVFGRPTATLRAALPRTDFHRLRATSTWTIVAVGVLLLFALAVAMTAFGRIAVIPLLRLARHAERLRRSGDWSLRIRSTRTDEIGTLSAQIDELMAEVERRTSELTQLSLVDALTGLLNRRAFDLQLLHAWQLMSRLGAPLALLVCDLDRFKAYNDRYGHPAGDACLQRVARALREAARRNADGVFRIGGEEFAVLLLNADLDAGRGLALRLLHTVQDLAIEHEGNEHGFVTISIGIASMVPRGDVSERDLIAAADHALYDAKHAGRNVVRPLATPDAGAGPRVVH
jgi:diguanylate cyclase (GGDEF)-like protein